MDAQRKDQFMFVRLMTNEYLNEQNKHIIQFVKL